MPQQFTGYTSYTPVRRRQSAAPLTPPKRRFHGRRMLFSGIAIISIFFLALHMNTTHATTQKSGVPTYTHSQTICIDPGHGGVDPGATSTDGLITERDINLVVALKMKHLLNADGYRVFMTRTTNSVSMDNRVRYTYCNQQHASILVAIHHNFFTDTTVDYASDLYYKPSDEGLANSIVAATAQTLNIPNDGIAQFEDGVLSESNMPAAVSEGFFITNDSEYALLTQPDSTRLSDEATGIVKGILTYFANPAKANAAVTSTQTLDRTDD